MLFKLSAKSHNFNILARILESGLNLVHRLIPGLTKKNVYFLFLFLIHDIYENNCEIDMVLPIITSPYNIQ